MSSTTARSAAWIPKQYFGFERSELKAVDFTAQSYLIVHPKGTLMWDAGVIADSQFKGARPVQRRHLDGDQAADAATRRSRLQAVRHHLLRDVALPFRSHRQRQCVRRIHLDRAEGRARRDVRGATGAIMAPATFSALKMRRPSCSRTKTSTSSVMARS